MIWAAVGLGLLVTLFGATSAAALITVSRSALAEAVSRRLRGGGTNHSLEWLREAEQELAAATATTALGVAVLGAALSALFQGITAELPLWAVVVLLVLVAVPFVLFSGYVLPRWLTAQRASRAADRLRPWLRPWSRALAALLPAPAQRQAADVRALWREGSAGGLARSDELVMVGNVIAFAERPVRDVMTPRTELVAIPEEAGYEEIRQAFVHSGYSRLPVYRGNLDEMVGMVHVFDLFKVKPGEPVPIRPVAMAPASRSCGDVLLDMQRERRHLAVVLDEYGGTLGIVTLEDLLEAMVGEIFDEHDESAPVESPAAGGGPVLLVETDGSTEVTEIEAYFGVSLPPGPSRTIGGRLVELAGLIPKIGDRFLLSGLELEVLRTSPTRIERLVIRRGAPPPTALDRAGAGA